MDGYLKVHFPCDLQLSARIGSVRSQRNERTLIIVIYLSNIDKLHEITFLERDENAETNEKRVRSREVSEKRKLSFIDNSNFTDFDTENLDIAVQCVLFVHKQTCFGFLSSQGVRLVVVPSQKLQKRVFSSSSTRKT